MSFDGQTYEPAHDESRLKVQLQRVILLMHDQRWRTLAQIAQKIGAPEASVSARLRDLRKGKFGGNTVERRSVGPRRNGLFEYRVIPPPEE